MTYGSIFRVEVRFENKEGKEVMESTTFSDYNTATLWVKHCSDAGLRMVAQGKPSVSITLNISKN